ncbi:MAG TPA: sugar transferase [Methylomusa anaerophila]|uniref:Putative sugar transferase EpsL n=1 Tax=Methylomusa anaerophila TaxID=1930071 RepID=A0A348AI25_9FIRM|nr:sugar transferase [Methylomusa anaerophila]BBB90723.1 putative sugar transferase EpsL [Methylomusa anaerophila]HML88674.1 sugar transferase [Methylomusa anaerophila]
MNSGLRVKRIFDLGFSVALIILLLPLMGAVAALIKINLGSPVVFRQQRPGLKGKPFYIYKFRTMTDAVDGKGNLLPDEQRLTTTGRLLRRLSLDELPQLLNVIKGDLSLVGPRPLLMEYLPRYNREQARRHDVKPGITGWAQVQGRNALTWEEKFRLDVWYVDNWSLGLDIKILLMTILKVAKREGINQSGHVTMPEFKGEQGGDLSCRN